MKPTTINVQITKSPKQFEAVRLGMDASIDAGETIEEAIKAATTQLNALYVEMYQPGAQKPANGEKTGKETDAEPKDEAGKGKEVLKFGDPRVQQICKRIENAKGDAETIKKILAGVKKFYEPDEQAQKTIDIAVKLNNQLKTN